MMSTEALWTGSMRLAAWAGTGPTEACARTADRAARGPVARTVRSHPRPDVDWASQAPSTVATGVLDRNRQRGEPRRGDYRRSRQSGPSTPRTAPGTRSLPSHRPPCRLGWLPTAVIMVEADVLVALETGTEPVEDAQGYPGNKPGAVEAGIEVGGSIRSVRPCYRILLRAIAVGGHTLRIGDIIAPLQFRGRCPGDAGGAPIHRLLWRTR